MRSFVVTITLPFRDPLYRYSFYVKKNFVRSTATAVVFLDDDHIVATDMGGCSMYLYRIDPGRQSATLLDSRLLSDEISQRICFSDLLDYDGERLLVCSNNWLATQTLYTVVDERLQVVKTLPRLTPEKKFCHGVKFNRFRKPVLGTANFHTNQLEFIDYQAETLLMTIPYAADRNPKDLVWVDAEHVLATDTTSQVLNNPSEQVPESHLTLFHVDIDTGQYLKLADVRMPDTHTDCVIHHQGLAMTTSQDSHEVYVHRLSRPQGAAGEWHFELVDKLGGYDRPHGLFFHEPTGELAVTNYGDSTVRIARMPASLWA